MADIGQATDLNIGSFAQNLQIAQAGADNVARNMQNAQNYQMGQFQLQQAQQAAETQKQFGADLAAAGGDPAKLQALALKYPGQAENIGKALGVQSEAHANQLNQAVGDLNLASKVGTDQAMAAAISKHRELIAQMGSSGQELFQMWKQNPQQFSGILNAAGLATVPYQKQKELEAQNYRTDATIRGQNMDFASQEANRDVQRSGQQIQREGQQITRETNVVKRQQMQQGLQEAKRKQFEDQTGLLSDYTNKVNTTANSLQAATDLVGPLTKDGQIDTSSDRYKRLTDAFGITAAGLRKIPGTETAATWADIQALQANARQTGVQALKGMGAVSDADAAAAQAALLSITPDTNAAQATKALNRYLTTLNKAQQSLTSPSALRRVSDYKVSNWAIQRGIDEGAAKLYIQALSKGGNEAQKAQADWAEAFPGTQPPQPGDF